MFLFNLSTFIIQNGHNIRTIHYYNSDKRTLEQLNNKYYVLFDYVDLTIILILSVLMIRNVIL